MILSVLAMDLLPSPTVRSYCCTVRCAVHSHTHATTRLRPSSTAPKLLFSVEKKNRNGFHRVRDIDRSTPLSGGRYKYAIQEKKSSKTVDTKGLGRAEFSEDSF